MGWIITFAVLFLLCILPLGVSLRYDEDGPVIHIIVGPIRFAIPLSGKQKKSDKPKQSKSKKQKKATKGSKPQSEPNHRSEVKGKQGGSVLDFLPLLRVVLDLLGSFRRKLRVNLLEVKLVMASGDPCTLGVNYGRAWATVGNLLPQLERVLVIKKRDIDIACDFTSSQTLITTRLDLTITFGRLLSLVSIYGFRGLKEFLHIMKKRKGGVSQ